MADRGVVQYTIPNDIVADEDVLSSKMQTLADIVLINLKELAAVDEVLLNNPSAYTNPVYRLGTPDPTTSNNIATARSKMVVDADVLASQENVLITNTNALLRIYTSGTVPALEYVKLGEFTVADEKIHDIYNGSYNGTFYYYYSSSKVSFNITTAGTYKFKMILNAWGTTLAGYRGGAYTEMGIYIDNTPYMIDLTAFYGSTGEKTYTNAELSIELSISAGTHTIGFCSRARATRYSTNKLYLRGKQEFYAEIGQVSIASSPLINVDENIDGVKLNLFINNLRKISQAFDYLNSEGMWTTNNYCAIGCQTSCQYTCQLACQSCYSGTCHDQNCGGWS